MMKARQRIRMLHVFAMLAVMIIGYQTFAMWQASIADRPAKVVWIDIERVFENLQIRAMADQQLNDLAASFDEVAQAKRQAIATQEEELEILAKGSDTYAAAEQQLLQLGYEYRGYLEFAKQKLEQRKARILGEIYEKIREGAAELSSQHGFDYVIVNDSLGSLAAGTEAEMNRQISARRMLYATNAFDATDLLIERMNNQ